MKINNIIKLSCIILILTDMSLTSSLDAAQRVNPEHDLSYLGAFRVPSDSSSNYSWGWVNEHSLVYNPKNDSLISPSMKVGGNKNFAKITEFSIPVPIISSTKKLLDLPRAKTIHDWTDITQGLWNQGYGESTLAGMAILSPKGTQTNSKLYWLTTSWYNPPQNAPTIGMSDLDFSNPNPRGPWIIQGAWVGTSSVPAAKTSRYMFNIPQEWADTYTKGYSIATGENKPNNNGSRGACIYAVKPWETETPPIAGSEIDSIELLCPGMDFAKRRNYNKLSWDNFSYLDTQLDGVWISIGNKSAVMFTGSVGTLTAADTGDCNKATEICEYYKLSNPFDSSTMDPEPTACTSNCPPSPDACPAGHDFRAEPYYRVLWFYDVNDLQAVAQGIKKSHEPQPYKIFNLENYLWAKGRCVLDNIGGIAYDDVNQRIFIMENKIDNTISTSDVMPIIHIFKINNSEKLADITPPSKPQNVKWLQNGTQMEISWDASSDDTGPLMYIVHRNNKPIIATTSNYYVDDVYSYFKAPYTYAIEARDVVNNSSSLTTITVPMIIKINSN